MFEIKLCAAHGAYNCSQCRTQRACADCEAYVFINTMVEKSDGRLVCRSCDAKILEAKREKAQPDLFVDQPGLFLKYNRIIGGQSWQLIR